LRTPLPTCKESGFKGGFLKKQSLFRRLITDWLELPIHLTISFIAFLTFAVVRPAITDLTFYIVMASGADKLTPDFSKGNHYSIHLITLLIRCNAIRNQWFSTVNSPKTPVHLPQNLPKIWIIIHILGDPTCGFKNL
jgi:hypothetical protein